MVIARADVPLAAVLGPQVVGILSDMLRAEFADESLCYALLGVVVSCAAWSVVHYALAARTLREDLERITDTG